MGGEAIHLAQCSNVIVICFSFNKDDPVKVYPPSLREFSSDDETDVSSYDSDSDISWPVVSPMTSSDEEDPFDECDEGESIEDVPIPPSTYHIEESSPTQQKSSTTEVPGYRLCGDNVDKSVKHRYMRSDAPAMYQVFITFIPMLQRIVSTHLVCQMLLLILQPKIRRKLL